MELQSNSFNQGYRKVNTSKHKRCIAFLFIQFSLIVFSVFSQTLLDLGSSVNYKDSQSLTPLYHSVLEGGELSCCLLLLRYSATLGCSDENGWTEMHQVGI